MKVRESLYLYLSLSLALAGNLSAQERLATKQLAGPIDEIRTGVMAPVDPAEAGIRSKSAVVAVVIAYPVYTCCSGTACFTCYSMFS